MRIGVLRAMLCLVSLIAGNALAQQGPPARHAPAQIKYHIDLTGVNATQISWWFTHLADKHGQYWRSLAPENNQDINWIVDPREDSHHIIGAVFESDQRISAGLFPDDKLHMQVQFADFVTQNRGIVFGQQVPLVPVISVPDDYVPAHPTPIFLPFGPGAMRPTLNAAANGFNEHMIFFDGQGFAPGRILWSWVNTGDDDTAANQGKPRSVALDVTFYLTWMEGGNRPPTMAQDGYYYSTAQVDAIWSVWKGMLNNMPKQLPAWYNKDTQDDLARAKGYAVTATVDTGTIAGMTSKMEVWWWNHAMGDAPGNAYVFWAPSAHHTIRWLPGYSPADLMKGKPIPEDRVVPGIVYPDLQHNNLYQDGGGMMSFPPEMSPIPGIYKTINPMMIMSKEQVANFDKERFPIPHMWLLHQWQDTPGGLIHRSQFLQQLPLINPVTQIGFVDDHQNFEGLYKSTGKVIKLYNDWLQQQKTRK